MLLLNVGPSALALGLLVPVALDAGFDVCVIGRPGGHVATKVYRLSVSGPGGRLEYREVQWWDGSSTVDELPDDLLRRIKSSEGLLMTGSLRNAIVERLPFMIEVLERRPEGAETIVLACENMPHRDYGKLEQACSRNGALMLRTVVNRMCVELEPDSENDVDDRRLISAHRLFEWLVERPPGEKTSEVLDALAGVRGFDVVDDIEARQARKLWMVNGGHQALALSARQGNADHRLESLLGDGDDDDDLRNHLTPTVLVCLGYLHGAMNEALRAAYPSLRSNMDYGLMHVRAYSEHPDSVARVLAAFRRLNLVPFIEALESRLAAPARICSERGLSVEPFRKVIGVFLALVANVDAFADNVEVRRNPIDPSMDDEAITRFEAMLAPWAGDDASKLTAHFAQLLADHREAFSP